MITIDQNATDEGFNIQLNGEIIMDAKGNTPTIRRSVALYAVNLADMLDLEIELDMDAGLILSFKFHITNATVLLDAPVTIRTA